MLSILSVALTYCSIIRFDPKSLGIGFTMTHDTWMHRMVRPMVRPLVRTPVAPNQLTWLRLLIGVSAALVFAQEEDVWSQWGAALFLVLAAVGALTFTIAMVIKLRRCLAQPNGPTQALAANVLRQK